jgi:hypothetical protein
MPTEPRVPQPAAIDAAAERTKEKRPMPPAAERALAEAVARRAAGSPSAPAKEVQGRGGLDPTRYGDWEVAGLTSDF